MHQDRKILLTWPLAFALQPFILRASTEAMHLASQLSALSYSQESNTRTSFLVQNTVSGRTNCFCRNARMLVIPSHSLSHLPARSTLKNFQLHLSWINVPGEKLCLTLPLTFGNVHLLHPANFTHTIHCPPKTPNHPAAPFPWGLPFSVMLHESCSEMYWVHSVPKRVWCASHTEKCPSPSVFKLSRKPFSNWWRFGTLRELKLVILLLGEI